MKDISNALQYQYEHLHDTDTTENTECDANQEHEAFFCQCMSSVTDVVEAENILSTGYTHGITYQMLLGEQTQCCPANQKREIQCMRTSAMLYNTSMNTYTTL